jgi:hypothetical protein
VAELRGCPAPGDKFAARFDRREIDGNCEKALSQTTGTMQFSSGKFIFPVSGVANCRTDQLGCQLTVVCSNPLLSARLEFVGDITPDGGEINGSANFIRFYDGCEKAVYQVEAVAQ